MEGGEVKKKKKLAHDRSSTQRHEGFRCSCMKGRTVQEIKWMMGPLVGSPREEIVPARVISCCSDRPASSSRADAASRAPGTVLHKDCTHREGSARRGTRRPRKYNENGGIQRAHRRRDQFPSLQADGGEVSFSQIAEMHIGLGNGHT